jgi:hypothetical protein
MNIISRQIDYCQSINEDYQLFFINFILAHSYKQGNIISFSSAFMESIYNKAKHYTKYLVDNKYIQLVKNYSTTSHQCRTYQITSKLLELPIVEHQLTSKPLLKKIRKLLPQYEQAAHDYYLEFKHRQQAEALRKELQPMYQMINNDRIVIDYQGYQLSFFDIYKIAGNYYHELDDVIQFTLDVVDNAENKDPRHQWQMIHSMASL